MHNHIESLSIDAAVVRKGVIKDECRPYGSGSNFRVLPG